MFIIRFYGWVNSHVNLRLEKERDKVIIGPLFGGSQASFQEPRCWQALRNTCAPLWDHIQLMIKPKIALLDFSLPDYA